MWPFHRKTTLEDTGLFKGLTDRHSHILPGVDDGIPDMESALGVLERYEQLGVRAVWLTPHVMEDIPNTTAALRQRYEELMSAYHGSVKLNLAAEYMLDNGFEERLNNDDLLFMGASDYRMLLVETSYFNPPMGLYDIIARIRESGYKPLLAHPERYLYMNNSDYERLVTMGVLFQCNITSLTGAYGKEACRKFMTLLDRGWIHVLGTDVHRLESFDHAITRQCIDDGQRKLLMAVAPR